MFVMFPNVCLYSFSYGFQCFPVSFIWFCNRVDLAAGPEQPPNSKFSGRGGGGAAGPLTVLPCSLRSFPCGRSFLADSSHASGVVTIAGHADPVLGGGTRTVRDLEWRAPHPNKS